MEVSHLSFDEVLTDKVPLTDNRLQQVLLLFDLAFGLRDLLLPFIYLPFSHLVVTHLLLHLWKAEQLALGEQRTAPAS